MGSPVTIDVPHRLGREGARARMAARIGELAGHLPGGMAEVSSSWPEPYLLALDLQALGQRVAARLAVEETRVRVHLDLPSMLAMFTGAIEAAVAKGGAKLLEDRSGG